MLTGVFMLLNTHKQTKFSMSLMGCLYFSSHIESLYIKRRILVVASSYLFHVGDIA